jgi:glycosyltransferase involved in cell wall biosynthesis
VNPRVLVLTYAFPPMGGALSRRNARLARHLIDYGYEPVIVTGPASTGAFDPSLDLDGVEVRRLAGAEPARRGEWGRRAERWLRRPSSWRHWWHEEVQRAARDIGPMNLVHASIAPYESAETAVAVAQDLELPLVVDCEDAWALDEWTVYPTRAHRALELARMRRVLSAADAVVMNTPEAARRIRELVPDKTVAVVSSGVDPEEFLGGPLERGDGTFRIVHTGSLHTDVALAHRRFGTLRRLLGGGVPGVDFLTRSPIYLLEALAQLEPELHRPVELNLVGELTAEDEAALADSPIRVRRHGYLPHAETVALIRTADLLFLPMHNVREGSRVAMVPCKTYEYLASGKPILAAVPDGDARDLLARSGAALICRPADTQGITRALARELRRWRARIAAPLANQTVLPGFEYKTLAAELASVYDGVLHRAAGHELSRFPSLASS